MVVKCRHHCPDQDKAFSIAVLMTIVVLVRLFVILSYTYLMIFSWFDTLKDISNNANIWACIFWQAACQTHSAHVITGCGDGSVRVYDIRSQDMWVLLILSKLET